MPVDRIDMLLPHADQTAAVAAYAPFSKHDVTRVLLQLLHDLGYRHAAEALEQELHIHQLNDPDVQQLQELVTAGDYDAADQWISRYAATTPSTFAVFLVKRLKCLDLLVHQHQLEAALRVLQQELAPLSFDLPTWPPSSSVGWDPTPVETLARKSDDLLGSSSTCIRLLTLLLMNPALVELQLQNGWFGDLLEPLLVSRHVCAARLVMFILPPLWLPEHALPRLLSQAVAHQRSRSFHLAPPPPPLLPAVSSTQAQPTPPVLLQDGPLTNTRLRLRRNSNQPVLLFGVPAGDAPPLPLTLVHTLLPHTNEVWFSRFLPSGRYLVTLGLDEQIVVYDVNASFAVVASFLNAEDADAEEETSKLDTVTGNVNEDDEEEDGDYFDVAEDDDEVDDDDVDEDEDLDGDDNDHLPSPVMGLFVRRWTNRSNPLPRSSTAQLITPHPPPPLPRLRTTRLPAVRVTSKAVLYCAWLHDERYLLTLGYMLLIKLWDVLGVTRQRKRRNLRKSLGTKRVPELPKVRCVRRYANTDRTHTVEFVPNDPHHHFFRGLPERHTRLYALDGTTVHEWSKHRVADLAVHPHGLRVAMVTRTGQVLVYNVDMVSGNFDLVVAIPLEREIVLVVWLVTRESEILVHLLNGELQLWSVETPSLPYLVQRYLGHFNPTNVMRLCFGNWDESVVLLGDEKGRVFVWDRVRGLVVGVVEALPKGDLVNAVDWNRGGHGSSGWLWCSVGDDRNVHIWGK